MKFKPLSRTKTMRILRYIAQSPSRENGGFHPSTIMAAKSALHYLKKP